MNIAVSISAVCNSFVVTSCDVIFLVEAIVCQAQEGSWLKL